MTTELKAYGSTSASAQPLLKQEHTTSDDSGNIVVVISEEEEEDKEITTEQKEDNDIDEEFVLELPRSILSAYILIHINGDWNKYTLRGQIGIILSIVIPLSVQGLATVSLAATLDWKHLRIETEADELMYNIAALTALFIYMLNDIRALTQSTWYYLGRVEEEVQVLWNMNAISNRIKNMHRMKSNFTALQKTATSTMDPRNWSLMAARKNINYLQFRIIIVGTMAMYIYLTFYGLMQMNLQRELVNKLDVALSIFIILEVDDWAYKLFIVQNRILEDNQFDITLKVRQKGDEQSTIKKENALWFSILTVLFFVAAVVVASAAYNIYEQYID